MPDCRIEEAGASIHELPRRGLLGNPVAGYREIMRPRTQNVPFAGRRKGIDGGDPKGSQRLYKLSFYALVRAVAMLSSDLIARGYPFVER